MAEKETGLTTVLEGQGTDVAIYRAPEQVLAEAHKAAVALQDVIKNKADPVIMNGQQYLEYEDWQTVARFYGITAKVESVEFVQYGSVRGFSASAVALRADGFELSRASADCLSDEPKWSTKPKYEWQDKQGGGREKVQIGEENVPLFQLKSMAQTRACAKVLRNVLAWVVVLAGYKATPAEELEAERASSGERAAGSGRSEGATQQASSGGGGSQGSASASAAGQPEGATKVKSVSTKKGENARGPWVKYSIKFEDGRSASTFSKTDGEHAEHARESGAYVIPKIKKEGDFFNLECFEPWPKKEAAKKEEHPSAQHDEPIAGPEKILTIRQSETNESKRDDHLRWYIQTSKRILVSEDKHLVQEAIDARKDGMTLTPRANIIADKNWLVAWEETIPMHEAEAAQGRSAPAENPPAEGAKEEKAPRGRKKGAPK